MTIPNKLLLMIWLACGVAAPVFGYERATHAGITNAFQSSNLNFPSNGLLLQQLGLDVTTLANEVQPLGFQYVSIQGSATDIPVFIAGDIYEFITIADALHRLPNIDIPFWLMCGVVREDDVPGDPAGIDANIDGSFYRVLNHFYDPVNDKPLNGLLITPGAIALNGFAPVKAPDWATGAKDSFGSPNTLDPATRNNYTVFEAHEPMFR